MTGHRCRRVPQDYTRCLDAELLAQQRGGVVTQPVWPPRQNLRFAARLIHGIVIAVSCVSLADSLGNTKLDMGSDADLWILRVETPLSFVLKHRLPRAEQERLRIAEQECLQDLLRPRSNEDLSANPMMLRLVRHRMVKPDRLSAINVAGSHDNELARPHAGQPLQFEHRSHLRGNPGEHRLDVAVGTRRSSRGTVCSSRLRSGSFRVATHWAMSCWYFSWLSGYPNLPR